MRNGGVSYGSQQATLSKAEFLLMHFRQSLRLQPAAERRNNGIDKSEFANIGKECCSRQLKLAQRSQNVIDING